MLPYIEVRLMATLFMLAVGVVLDITNKRNIPDYLLYIFLGLSLIISFLVNTQDMFLFGGLQAILLIVAGYLMYRKGAIGMADPIYFAIIALIFPQLPDTEIP